MADEPVQQSEDHADMATGDAAHRPDGRLADKKVFLVAAFRPDGGVGRTAPATGMAEDVVAVIGMEGERQRFEWVGGNERDSIRNPALVTPVKVRLALPSPWHAEGEGMVTGLVQLAPAQLGSGTVDEDVDHLLSELAKSRASGGLAG